MTLQISVIGAGSWGTTLAKILAEKGYPVKIWAYEKETVDNINERHENPQYLPEISLPENLVAFNDFQAVIPDANILVSAVPSHFVRAMAEKYAPFFREDKEYKLVSVSKGLEHETFKLMSQILREVLPDNVKIAALSGPNHAEELAREMPTATVIASLDEEILDELVDTFHTEYFKTYGLTDENGIEICGAIKNISALAIGICDGLGLGDNAKASLMTLGLNEMNRIGRQFGCARKTFFGIAGVGDLIATCTSKHSRNRFYGEELAKGKSFEQIREEMHGMVAEGVWATESVFRFAQEHGIDLPLTQQMYQIIYEDKPIKDAIKDLLALI